MVKLKIGFDSELNWDLEIFRKVMYDLSLNTDKYELFLITGEGDEDKIDAIAAKLNLKEGNIYPEFSKQAIVDTVTSLKIDIYLTPYLPTVSAIAGVNNTTANIFVNPQIQDVYQMNPKWFDILQFWINRMFNEQETRDC